MSKFSGKLGQVHAKSKHINKQVMMQNMMGPGASNKATAMKLKRISCHAHRPSTDSDRAGLINNEELQQTPQAHERRKSTVPPGGM